MSTPSLLCKNIFRPSTLVASSFCKLKNLPWRGVKWLLKD